MKTVREIVSEYLKANGYDGLWNPDDSCGCLIEDLGGPCCDSQMDCQAGYRGECPGHGACENCYDSYGPHWIVGPGKEGG